MASNLSEVRQCTDPDHPLFGAVAVASGVPGMKWSVMTVANGGHHNADDDTDGVKDWAVLTAPARKPKKGPA